jgi:hypothetical protein
MEEVAVSPEPPPRDIETLWRDQTPESDPVTLEQIHLLARKVDHRSRRLLVFATGGLAVNAFIYGQLWQMFHDALTRTGLALTLAGVLMCGYLGFSAHFRQRDPAQTAGAYLRLQLQSSLRRARGGWLVSLAALLPGLAILEVATLRNFHGPLWALLFPQILLVLMVAFVIVSSRRAARRLEQELARLDQLLKT